MDTVPMKEVCSGSDVCVCVCEATRINEIPKERLSDGRGLDHIVRFLLIRTIFASAVPVVARARHRGSTKPRHQLPRLSPRGSGENTV